MVLNNQWINDQIKTEIRQCMGTNDNNNNMAKSVGCSEGRAKREIYCNTGLPHERRTIPYEQSKFTINKTRKGRMRPKVSRRRDIIKIRA